MEIGLLINEWAESGFSDEKLGELKQRYPEAEDLVLAGRIMQESRQLQPQFEQDLGVLWEKIERKVDGVEEPEPEVSETAPPRPYRRLQNQVRGIVVTLFLLLVVLITVNGGGNGDLTEKVTRIGVSEVIDFPDGSQVYLGSSSTLRWNPDTWSQNRSLDLEGEAFFEVAAGSPFTVGTGKCRILVQGTSFNVRVRERVLDIACKTGGLSVSYPNVKEYLNAGQSIRIGADSKAERGTVAPGAIGAWREGRFAYQGEALSSVFAELHRQFNYQIDALDRSIEEIPFHGFFTNENLESALKQVCTPLSLSFQIDPARKWVNIRR